MDKKKIFGKLGKIKGGKTSEVPIYTLIRVVSKLIKWINAIRIYAEFRCC